MEIKGFIDVSFSDWDGKISSVIFLPRCNFRCPFCYNKRLVLEPETMPTIEFGRIEKYLEANRKWIDGVVITGGEPTLHKELPVLCSRLKGLRFSVKVDTNGTNPAVLRNLIESQLVDYVAVDVKAPLAEDEYSRVSGINATTVLERIMETLQMLLEEVVDYEFRTTLVPALHKPDAVERICQAIKGCKKYAIQGFKSDVEVIDPRFRDMKPFSKTEMDSFLQVAKKIVPDTIFRG